MTYNFSLTLLNVLNLKCSTGCVSFGDSRGEHIYLPFPASRGFIYLFIYLFIEMFILVLRERQSISGEGAEKRRHNLKQALGSELSVSTEPNMGLKLMNCEIMT